MEISRQTQGPVQVIFADIGDYLGTAAASLPEDLD